MLVEVSKLMEGVQGGNIPSLVMSNFHKFARGVWGEGAFRPIDGLICDSI